MGADAIVEAVVGGPQGQRPFEIVKASLGIEQSLVAEGELVRGEARIRGLKQELAVEVLLGADPGAVDRQSAAL